MDDQVESNSDLVENKTDKIEAKKTKVKVRADQDQIISNFTGDMEANLDALDTDAELAALMAKRGFNEPKLAQGQALLTTLKTAFQARQVALGTQGEKATASETEEKAARDKYADFRTTVRTAFADSDTCKALGVSGLVPVDTEKFLTLAEAGYNAATQDAYVGPLAELGFDGDEQAASLATLTAFRATRTTHQAAIAAAKAATKERDDAYKLALKWNSALNRMAKIALRERPDLLARLR